MTDVMAHRGPNDRGTYLRRGVALGVRRLSIVDVEGGHQPFANEDGTSGQSRTASSTTMATIRSRLGRRGHRFATQVRHRDHAAPLRGRTGTRFPEQLRGMFGLALWDGRERRAVIARDRLGVKPLYYAEAGDLLVFASELKSVLASGLVSTELDYEAIDAYPHARLRARPADAARRRAQADAGHRLVVDGAARAASVLVLSRARARSR